MGLLRAELMEIMRIISAYKEPRILMLGKQDIYVEADDLADLLKRYGFGDFDIISCCDTSGKIDAYRLFKMLGHGGECHALDYSDYEGADIIYDLNCDNLSDDMVEEFDLIIDGGTLEHIYNPANAMKNISKMLRENGTIYHMVPCAGLIDHGFFSFSPTFFIDYYEKNGFLIDTIRMQYKPERGIYKFVYYSMDCRLFLNSEGINSYIKQVWNKGGEIMIQCMARKCNHRDVKNSLLQTRYQHIYGDKL